MPHKGGRLAVSAAEAQQPCTVVGGIEQPLLERVVLSSAHQQWLPRKEVQGSQRCIVRVLQDVAQELTSASLHLGFAGHGSIRSCPT